MLRGPSRVMDLKKETIRSLAVKSVLLVLGPGSANRQVQNGLGGEESGNGLEWAVDSGATVAD